MKFLSLSLLLVAISAPSLACDPHDPLCGLDGQPLPFDTASSNCEANPDNRDPLCGLSDSELLSAIADSVANESGDTSAEEAEEVLTEESTSEETPAAPVAPVVEEKTQISCRDAVVAGKKLVGETLDPASFSNTTFEDLNMTIEELNALSIEEQAKIYMQVTPMEVMVEATVSQINEEIEEYSGYLAALFADKLQQMRAAKDQLKSCIK